MRATDTPPLEKRPERPGFQEGSRPAAGRAPGQRLLAAACAVAVNLMAIAALFWPQAGPPPPAQPEAAPLTVTFVELPKPDGSPDTGQAAPLHLAAPTPVTAPTPVLAAIRTPDNSDLLSEAQLAGAAGADGEGGGGGGCDTARLVQKALQRDPLVRAAVEDAHRLGKAVMLWNGDWVRSGDQDGKGLSAVREAIIWELAFAPKACRNRPVHGLVLLSLADGNTRFAIGSADWRWSDLLGVRAAPSER